GDFVHITPGVHMGGKVKIGENSYIGLGASIIHEIQIGKNTIIGAGSVVVKDIDDNIKAYGNPCSPKLLS
ncbi:MAG: transferase, partial [bacterium]|nr:transferase [bacterium]